MGEEHRRFVRHKALKGGRIVFNNGHSTITCTIRDWSPAGARLEVASAVGIADEFILAFDDGTPKQRCQVRRRTPTSIGVEFAVSFNRAEPDAKDP